MIKRRHTGRHVARLLLVGAMSAGLAACGGSSGDDDPIGGDTDIDLFDPNDVDGDGTPNALDEDFADDVDGDGIPNAEDDDFDPGDRDGDGIPNLEDDDVDGDGIVNDLDDDFVENDADGDGFTDPTAENACGSANGTDADSSNNDWNDNCTVSRFNQFADSLYSAGIQRVVYCTTDSVPGESVDAFTDGEFGPGTRDAVVAYQTANTLGNDGVVGPQTWASLQGELVAVTGSQAVFEGDGPFFDGYTVAGDRCGGEVLFYNEVTAADDGLSVDRLGWRLARGAGSDETVPFSTAPPFNVVD